MTFKKKHFCTPTVSNFMVCWFQTSFFFFVPSKLSRGCTLEVFVPLNGLIVLIQAQTSCDITAVQCSAGCVYASYTGVGCVCKSCMEVGCLCKSCLWGGCMCKFSLVCVWILCPGRSMCLASWGCLLGQLGRLGSVCESCARWQHVEALAELPGRLLQ